MYGLCFVQTVQKKKTFEKRWWFRKQVHDLAHALSAHHLASDELFVGAGCVACCLMWCVMEFPLICGPGLASERGMEGWTQFKDSVKSEVLAVFRLRFNARGWGDAFMASAHKLISSRGCRGKKNVANLQSFQIYAVTVLTLYSEFSLFCSPKKALNKRIQFFIKLLHLLVLKHPFLKTSCFFFF